MFQSILYLALKRKINIKEVFTDPLTLIPLIICHTDGKMSKTTKRALMKELEKSKGCYWGNGFPHLHSDLTETSEFSRYLY